MNKESNIAEYVKKLINHIPAKDMSHLLNISQQEAAVLRASSDSEITNFILKRNLMVPGNLAKFVVNLHFEELSCIYDEFYNIRKDYQNEWQSKLQSAQDKFNYGLNNPSTREQDFLAARHQVMDCVRIFENDFLEHVSQIRGIDNQSEWKYFFLSFFNLLKCRKEIPLAIESSRRLLLSYKLLFTISSETNDDLSSLKNQFQQTEKKIMANGTCLLMANYCESNDDKDFWYDFRNLWEENWHMILDTNLILSSEQNLSSFWEDDDLEIF